MAQAGQAVSEGKGTQQGNAAQTTPEASALPAETQGSAEGRAVQSGQAGQTVVVERPERGETVVVETQQGTTYVLDFDPAAAEVAVDDGDLVMLFDGGETRLVFQELAAVAEGAEPVYLRVGDDLLDAGDLYGTTLAMADPTPGLETVAETEAGEIDTGGGGTDVYSDEVGTTIGLLSGSDVLGATVLDDDAPAVPEDDDIPFEALLLDAGPDPLGEPPTLLINEVGLSVPGGGDAPSALAAQQNDFVELRNPAGADTVTAATTVEFLNPGGAVVTLALPDGVTIPAGGFLVLSQDAGAGAGGDATVFGAVHDSAGNPVADFTIDDADAWGLGADTTQPLAVNLVFDASASLDSFAANLDADDLAALTDAQWTADPAAVPASLALSLETFNGAFTADHNVFSRVTDGDSDTAAEWTTNDTPTVGALNDVDGGEEGAADPNPADPQHDDLDPQQPDGDPLAGQTVVAAAGAGGALLEGGAGPDFLFGGEGDDSLYGGTQAETAAQQAAAGDTFATVSYDHNDFLFGGNGADRLHGGAGGDHIIGGLGHDGIDGGSGNDTLFGTAAPVGGVADGALPAPGAARVTEVDRIAGDGLDNRGGGQALVRRGGDDSIDGGLGDDFVAGEALAYGDTALAEVIAADNADPAIPSGGDTITGFDGFDSIAGEALAVGGSAEARATLTASAGGTVGDDLLRGLGARDAIAGEAFALGTTGTATASADNAASDGAAGGDSITGDSGFNRLSGDAMAEAVGTATAESSNEATGATASAGDDTLTATEGDDLIAGDAFARTADAASASAGNSAEAGGSAGNDVIDGADGINRLSGDALAIGNGGSLAEVDNSGDGDATVGSDGIRGGSGRDSIAGDALAQGGGTARATHGIAPAALAMVGSDIIDSGDDDDVIAGDALALDGGDAEMTGAVAGDGMAGDDSILGGGGADIIAGDALSEGGTAEATYGGDDTIDGGSGDDRIAGDALAYDGGTASATLAGSDLIHGGEGADTIYGDASGSADTGGNDSLHGDAGDDVILGGGGDDLLEGAGGADTLDGGAGDDTLIGGDGGDSFRIGPGTPGETDVIADFSTGEGDVLDFGDVLEGAGDVGSDLANFLQVSSDGTDTTIAVDANGDGSGYTDQSVVVEGQDLTTSGASQAEILQAMVDSGSLTGEP